MELIPLSLSALTQLEANELVKRFLSDMEAVPPAGPRVEVTVFNQYVQGLTTRSGALQKALLQVQGNAATQTIVALDGERDTAMRVLRKAIKLALDSDVPAEAEAAHKLTVLLAMYKKVEHLNYESETMALDKLMDELQSASYAPMVTSLLLTRYVQRLKASNDNFKAQFGSRITGEAFQESFDTRALRQDLMDYYRDFALYLQVMANTSAEPYFSQVLSIVNTARQYYANMVATRRGRRAAQPAGV